jgi:hypothetical protein
MPVGNDARRMIAHCSSLGLRTLVGFNSSSFPFRPPQEATMKDPDTPKGAIALMIVYAFIILALWGNVYLTVLARGATQ